MTCTDHRPFGHGDSRPSGGSVVDAPLFRRVLGHYPTGVCVVTATRGGRPVGMVVGSFTSASLDPPMIAFFPDRRSSSWALIREAEPFCVHVLSHAEQGLCHRFAAKGGDKFAGLNYRHSADGSPVLPQAALRIDCTIDAIHPAGDHDVVLARVLGLFLADGPTSPLLFFQGGYGTFTRCP